MYSLCPDPGSNCGILDGYWLIVLPGQGPKWLSLCRFFFFSYILPHGNFITSKIKKKECLWIKGNQCLLLHGEYIQCYWNMIWNLKLTLSVVLLSYFFPSLDLLRKSNILRKSKLKDSESNHFWNKTGKEYKTDNQDCGSEDEDKSSRMRIKDW